MPDSLATYAGKKSARTLLYETTIFARLGYGVALPLRSTCVALEGASDTAQDARTTMPARAIANVRVIGRLPLRGLPSRDVGGESYAARSESISDRIARGGSARRSWSPAQRSRVRCVDCGPRARSSRPGRWGPRAGFGRARPARCADRRPRARRASEPAARGDGVRRNPRPALPRCRATPGHRRE